MTKTKIINVAVTAVFAMFVIISLFSGGGVSVYASASEYTNVLTDLKSDKTFDASSYPEKVNDESINVIQIGESENRELFIYTYQPSGQFADLKATSISISRTLGDNWRDYDLTFLNSNGVFFKYEVKYFDVSTDPVRYYDITTIWERTVAVSGNDITAKGKAHEVAQRWEATTNADGTVFYEMEHSEVALIKDYKTGFRRFSNGTSWGMTSSCDAHYIAFNSDHAIDELIEADVTFKTQYYHTSISGTELQPEQPHTLTVKGECKAQNKPIGAFGQSYEWKQIQTAKEFVAESGDKFSEEEQAELLKYQWVLNFYETDYGGDNVTVSLGLLLINNPATWLMGIAGILGSSFYGTVVSDVSVLRLNFVYAGKSYNLGVVMDKVTGSQRPTGTVTGNNPPWWVWLVFGGITLITLIVYLALIIRGLPTTGGLIAFVWGVSSRFLVAWLASTYVKALTAIIPLLNYLCIAVSIAFVVPLIIKIAGLSKRRKRKAKLERKQATAATTTTKQGGKK